ncbi:MAG: hypothetical protein HYU73_19055 [Betaproteobacteria bacterium]|nr:hypothetical protein [Betaproteobacteria bacterium]MBI3052478.1 hypothetical protein [Betaproteobacteria bacterium]
MSTEALILLVLAVCVAYWYSRRPKADKLAPPLPPPPAFSPVTEPVKSEPDRFMLEILAERARTEAAVKAATSQHKRELEERFDSDLKVKERLSQFARTNELDKALIALWEEIKHYPGWSRRDDFEKWNKLQLAGINGSSEKDTNLVEFEHEGKVFKVSVRTWSGMESESYADFSFFEAGEEVFSISCSANYGDYETIYRCINVSSLKKRGNWAKVLLALYGQIQIAKNKVSAEFKYFHADEIKSRFEE